MDYTLEISLKHEFNKERNNMIYIMKDIQSGMKINKVMKKHSITATLVLAILQIQSQ